MLIRCPRPSLAAGFFVVPNAASDLANGWWKLWRLARARLWLACVPAACAWLTACSCLPAHTRPVTIQGTPGYTTPAINLDGEVNVRVLTFNIWGLPSWMNQI